MIGLLIPVYLLLTHSYLDTISRYVLGRWSDEAESRAPSNEHEFHPKPIS